jgi:hypothetical protein
MRLRLLNSFMVREIVLIALVILVGLAIAWMILLQKFPIFTTTRFADYSWKKSGFVGNNVLFHVDKGRGDKVITETAR